MQQNQKDESMREVTKAIEALQGYIKEYKSTNFKTYDEIPKPLHNLKSTEGIINEVLGRSEVENPELEKEAKDVLTQSSRMLRGMAAEMRMKKK